MIPLERRDQGGCKWMVQGWLGGRCRNDPEQMVVVRLHMLQCLWQWEEKLCSGTSVGTTKGCLLCSDYS